MELSWQVLNNHPPEKISQFAQQLNSSPVLARVLLNRGIEDIESARRFFKPNFTNLHDPFLMAGMSEAVKRIETAITKKEKTLIYGDYDVDGTTATSMLMRFFHLLGHHFIE